MLFVLRAATQFPLKTPETAHWGSPLGSPIVGLAKKDKFRDTSSTFNTVDYEITSFR